MKIPGCIFLFSLGILICSCSSSEPPRENPARVRATPDLGAAAVAQSDTSIIAVGDSVIVSVWGYPEFSTRAIVASAGTITIPMIGEQLAMGMKKDELSRQILRKLAEYIKGDIKLSVETQKPSPRITILGSVNRSGSYPSIAEVPLLEVLANAGGWTDEADLRYIKINRAGTSASEGGQVEVNLSFLMEHGNTRAIPFVHPGDVVIVPKKENFVREVSDFMRDAILLIGVFGLTQ